MLFNSIDFLIFFPVVVGVYFALPARLRWMLLLAASYFFYAWWKFDYLFLILTSTLVDYVSGRMMGRYDTRARRRPWLLLSLCTNLGILGGFKYFNFISGSLQTALSSFGLTYDALMIDVVLPVGISFYTFQTLAYSIDVYRGEQQPEKHLGIFALYVSFFPQLVAGPIERSQNLLPQFKTTHTFEHERVRDGLILMAWGFFKKLVVADRLALYVDEIYNAPGEASGAQLLVATYFFAFQIYCDFSGYSDIAIGAAQVMGYDLMENFRRPYFSKSVGEFWKRWHISLSSWFKDYLYIPLGGNRVGKWHWYFNLFVVFLISGLWHGAAWTFVVWGALHGGYLIAGIVTKPWREKLWVFADRWLQTRKKYTTLGFSSIDVSTFRRWTSVLVTFHLVLLAWIFFRANTVTEAFYILEHIFSGKYTMYNLTGDLDRYEFLIALVSIAVMELVHLMERKVNMRSFLSNRPMWLRYPAYLALVISILMFGQFGAQEFIYFQF
ncbi:MBOAT family O-acyltransferase [Salinibacter sp.]|uniref:MBOAT family O-acyltransferase n=1 Tax=Salinibacter sp. TaxID=2065818 RepID=UPI0021E7C551|nr:MBOAT family O-acyltransferase [Salinibacter sp.]